MTPASLDSFRKSTWSQNGEDGIIEEVLRRCGIDSGWVCEFGAWDGRHLSNTHALVQRGFHAVLIEADADRCREIAGTAVGAAGSVHAVNSTVQPTGPASLDAILATTPIPRDFELLSIDVDGDDYFIWEQMTAYSAKIVVIEVNSSFGPFRRVASKERGSSFASMVALGRAKRYTPIAHTGNLILVRHDWIDRIELSWSERAWPSGLFDWRYAHRSWHRLGRLARLMGYRKWWGRRQPPGA